MNFTTISFLLYLFLNLFNSVKTSEPKVFDPNAVSHITKSFLLSSIEEGNQNFLIYFYTSFDECPKCKELMPLFQEAVGYLDELEDHEIKSHKLAVKLPEYGVTTFPQLIYFDGKTPFRYDENDIYQPDDIVEWIEECKQTPIPELTDATFEHLTQSSTGSTTGDWIILFANSKRPECMKPLLADLGTLAARFRRRKNVATLCTQSNPQTAQRFGFSSNQHCTKILFFHRTSLYHYENEDIQIKDLIKFVTEGYKTVEAKDVPLPISKIDIELQSSIFKLNQMIYEHIQSGTTVFILAILFAIFIIGFTFILILRKIQTKKLA